MVNQNSFLLPLLLESERYERRTCGVASYLHLRFSWNEYCRLVPVVWSSYSQHLQLPWIVRNSHIILLDIVNGTKVGELLEGGR